MSSDYEIVEFKSKALFREWLTEHHGSVDGIWIKLYKKASGIPSVTYAEALDEALCFGWIDGQRKGYDEVAFMQKFTPRRAKSLWSKRNIEHVERLNKSGLTTPAGIAEIDRAKQDGRWAAAYDMPSKMVVPEAFLTELDNHPTAKSAFLALNKSETYSIVWRLQTVKTEAGYKRRQQKIIETLESVEHTPKRAM